MAESARTVVERRVARLRALGWRGVVEIERDTLRRILKTTFAATLAWEAATWLNSPRPVLAALGAILTVQITVRTSLARSIQLTIGVTFGLASAIVLGKWLGLHWWSIAIVVLAGLIAGELLRLGPFAPQAAISGMLALSFGSAYGYARVTDTVIGAVIGVLVNALIAPPSYVRQASADLRRVAEDLAALLGDIGAGVRTWPDRAGLERWLSRARGSAADVRRAGETVAQGEESLRYNPRARGEMHTLERLDEARRALEHSVVQTRGIARSLLDLDLIGASGVDAQLESFGALLHNAAQMVAAFGRLQERPDRSAERAQSVEALERAKAAQASLVEQLGLIEPVGGQAQLQLSAMLVDAERLLHEVDVSSGAHTAGVAEPG